jgi:hypothetical protein
MSPTCLAAGACRFGSYPAFAHSGDTGPEDFSGQPGMDGSCDPGAVGCWSRFDGDLRVDRQQFWRLVEQTRGEGCKQHAARLAAQLRVLPLAEMVAFQRIFDELMDQSYRWDLWGAAYLTNGGCSDDGFKHFRRWLLSQRQATWEQVLRDPDSLAAHPQLQDPDWRPGRDYLQCQDLGHAASRAYAAVTGRELYQAMRDQELVDVAGEPSLPAPAAEKWSFDDDEELRRRYPRLWSRVCRPYGEDP